MSTFTTASPMTNATDANFRAWGSWLSASLASAGWVLVGSVFVTGTNWTDVTAPAAGNTARVTELWRMADAHQATAPLFMLIDYGETATADACAVRIRLGTGGTAPTTLVGQFFDTGTSYFGITALNTNNMTHYASGDTHRFCVAFAVTGTSWVNTNIFGWGIERRVNGSGAAQATGFLFYRYASSSTRGQIAFKGDGTGALSTIIATMGFPAVYTAEANMTFDAKQAIHPLVYGGLGPSEIGLNMVCAPAAAYGAGGTFNVDILGGTHTYIALNDQGAYTVIAGTASQIEPAMRYE